MISTAGVYLSGATYWYARFDDEMVTFTLDVQLPLTWEAVSQGRARGMSGATRRRMCVGNRRPYRRRYILSGGL